MFQAVTDSPSPPRKKFHQAFSRIRINAMSISPVSNAVPAFQTGATAKVVPFKRDRDGDYDNNRAETQKSEAAEASKSGQLLNIKT
jgi:hypothetical protein